MSEHKNVFMALAAAQMEMDPVKKGAINPAFKGEGKPRGTPYADLADVLTAVLPALNKHGIALFHVAGRDEHGGIMTTILYHGASDTKIECPVPLIVGKNDMQGFKSATSYAKRIGTESVTGVAPEDDDGNAAAAAAPTRATPRPEPAPNGAQPHPAPAQNGERVLTKHEGEAIIQAISERRDWLDLDEYMAELGRGPMAFAVHHPKIKVAVAERRAELSRAAPAEQQAATVDDSPFVSDEIPY